jgi:hypothetical protein
VGKVWFLVAEVNRRRQVLPELVVAAVCCANPPRVVFESEIRSRNSSGLVENFCISCFRKVFYSYKTTTLSIYIY